MNLFFVLRKFKNFKSDCFDFVGDVKNDRDFDALIDASSVEFESAALGEGPGMVSSDSLIAPLEHP